MSLLLCSVLLGAITSCAGEPPTPPIALQAAPRSTDAVPRPGRGAQWPLAPTPRVERGFEQPPQPWAAGHRGVDLRGATGQHVRSALAGRVVFSGVVAGRGVLSIEHATGHRTTYEPLENRVPVGTRVAAGGRIGRLDDAGSHCAPTTCLHWGLLVAPDAYRDPLTLLGGRRTIVLLPLR